jgi:hypothetical protein
MRLRHSDDTCFKQMSSVALNVVPLSSKESVFVFLLRTYGTLLRSAAPPDTVLQLDVFLLQMQFVYQEISLETQV